MLSLLFHGVLYPAFLVGLIVISLISFYDDIAPVSSRIRLACHLGATSLLFTQTDMWEQEVLIILFAYVIIIGTINAYNFMDGINGIVAAYSLATIFSLYWINEYVVQFILSDLLIVCSASLLVFAFFNFRSKAVCFAGDVGSVSMAYIILFFMIMLIIRTGEVKYIGLLLLYGLDTVSTLFFRLARRENIFEAHRTHFYQYLVNVKEWPHLLVSSIYTSLQLVINLIIIYYITSVSSFIFLCIVSGVLTVILRFFVEGRKSLLEVKI